MQTALDCLPCLFRQALRTARLSSDSLTVQKKILDGAADLFPRLDMTISPPENAVALYRLIAALSGCKDPYAGIKTASNAMALELRPRLEEQIKTAEDPLLTAIKYAIAGNVIDYGAQHEFDAAETIRNCLTREPRIMDYEPFRRDMAAADTILYLGDNCGELVFDGLLIDFFKKKRVIYAVKDRPVINDATLEDALACGLDRHCEVVANGTDCPGTSLSTCSASFRRLFVGADLIISKGQGNFETLSASRAPIYFLLTVKCAVVADHIAALTGKPTQPGDMIFMKNPKGRRQER